jgi:hypothetical protein
MTRPGYKTTEFWMALIPQVLGVLETVSKGSPWGLVISAASAGVYAVARAVAKRG